MVSAYKFMPAQCIYIHWNLSIKDTLGPNFIVLNTEDSSIQRSFYTLQYYIGTQNGILITEVSTFQRSVIERLFCICKIIVY